MGAAHVVDSLFMQFSWQIWQTISLAHKALFRQYIPATYIMNVGTVNTRKQHSMATVLYKFVVKIQQFRRQIRVFFPILAIVLIHLLIGWFLWRLLFAKHFYDMAYAAWSPFFVTKSKTCGTKAKNPCFFLSFYPRLRSLFNITCPIAFFCSKWFFILDLEVGLTVRFWLQECVG